MVTNELKYLPILSNNIFVINWSVVEDSFTKDAPNALLFVDEQTVQQDTRKVELFNVPYNTDKKTLIDDLAKDNTPAVE